MPQQPSFPPEVLAVLGDIDSITSPKQGATSQVWIVECAAGTRVIKYAPQLPFRDWLWREADVLHKLAPTALPIPRLYFNGHHQSQPLPYIVMSCLPGEPLSTVFLRETDSDKRLHWMSKFGASLRHIHDTSVPQNLFFSQSWLDERLTTAARYIEAGYDLDTDDPPHLLEKLQANRPNPVPQTLIHGDFMWDNVLVQDGEITGIVDWGGGAYGDPRYDLALALLPHEDGDLSDAEVTAFYAGYGCDPLTESDYHYFNNLYEFF
jgi:aminoglycoside phosphotransferase (APT) family kinase protein